MKASVRVFAAFCIFSHAVFAQHIDNGRLVFPERRMTAFASNGASREILELISSRINSVDGEGPGSWVAEWREVGDHYWLTGEQAEAAGDRAGALKAYYAASVYYSISGFPEYHSTAEKASLKKHFEAYKKAGRFMSPPLEVVPVKVQGHTIETFLHRPEGIAKPPLILWTGGIDQYKGNSYYPVRHMLAKGFAVATFDIAGTGESTFWKLRPDGEFVHLAVLDHFAKRTDLDTTNIFEVGRSFGGYYAAKMAARNDPRLRAVAAVCAPVHALFTQSREYYEGLLSSPGEGRTIIGMAHRLGVKPTVEELWKALSDFSLVNQGVLGKGRIIRTPLLVFNGGRDPLVPQSDMKLLAASGTETELWVLGMDTHCAAKYGAVVGPQLADWFRQYMTQ